MILKYSRLYALGVVLAGLTAPALAQAPARLDAPRAAVDRQERAQSRRVELPFPLDIRPAEGRRNAPQPRASDAPHPDREIRLQRASREEPAGPGAFRALRLSRAAELG